MYRLPNSELFRVKSVSIPVIHLDEILAITDGHTRAVAAIIEGQDSVLV